MTSPISLPALRERRASASEPYVLRPDERDALVEAVEAAQAYLDAPDNHPDLGELFQAWLRAQARFDFEECTSPERG
jgi:hypothetical protein